METMGRSKARGVPVPQGLRDHRNKAGVQLLLIGGHSGDRGRHNQRLQGINRGPGEQRAKGIYTSQSAVPTQRGEMLDGIRGAMFEVTGKILGKFPEEGFTQGGGEAQKGQPPDELITHHRCHVGARSRSLEVVHAK